MNDFRAVSIDVDGVTAVHSWDVTSGLLKHLQGAVQGLVDVVRLSPDLDMWINDEGLVTGMLMNPVATAIAAAHGMTHQGYYGPAVFTGGADDDGETLPLSEAQATALSSVIDRCTG